MDVSRNNDLSGLNFENTQIQKMVFIFNAVNDGWTVKKLDVDTYEFNMDTEKIKKEIVLDDYLKKFIHQTIQKLNFFICFMLQVGLDVKIFQN